MALRLSVCLSASGFCFKINWDYVSRCSLLDSTRPPRNIFQLSSRSLQLAGWSPVWGCVHSEIISPTIPKLTGESKKFGLECPQTADQPANCSESYCSTTGRHWLFRPKMQKLSNFAIFGTNRQFFYFFGHPIQFRFSGSKNIRPLMPHFIKNI